MNSSQSTRVRSRKLTMTPAALSQAAECLRTLAHPVRLRMIQVLLGEAKLTVCELAEACEISQPQASEHLRLMQRCGFLGSQREGREVYYQVVESHLSDLLACIQKRFG